MSEQQDAYVVTGTYQFSLLLIRRAGLSVILKLQMRQVSSVGGTDVFLLPLSWSVDVTRPANAEVEIKIQPRCSVPDISAEDLRVVTFGELDNARSMMSRDSNISSPCLFLLRMPLGGDHQVASLDRLLPIPEDRSQAREHWEAILGSGPHAIIKSLESLLRVGNGECTRFWRGFDGCSPSSPGNLSLSLGRHDKAGVILVLRPTFARASMSLPGEPSGWVVREWVLGTRSIDSASEVLAPCNDQFPSDLTAVVKLLTEAITRFQKHRPLHVDSMNEEVIDF